jgi:hypothetical protein
MAQFEANNLLRPKRGNAMTNRTKKWGETLKRPLERQFSTKMQQRAMNLGREYGEMWGNRALHCVGKIGAGREEIGWVGVWEDR